MTKNQAMACAILTTSWLALGCARETTLTSTETEIGTVGLALSAVSPSGVEYRLRNAVFNLWGWPERCYDEDCDYYEQTVSSEDYLDQPAITLDLLSGGYEVFLEDGWEIEKIVDDVGEVVEAVLLSGGYQYIRVRPYRTTWVTYKFGIGDEELWFTGQLEIRMEVYEDPEAYYRGDCFYYGDGKTCWMQCCREHCDPYYGCWGDCWVEEIPCDEVPDDEVPDDEDGGVPVAGSGGNGPIRFPGTGIGGGVPY
jgi:hypothetical protein